MTQQWEDDWDDDDVNDDFSLQLRRELENNTEKNWAKSLTRPCFYSLHPGTCLFSSCPFPHLSVCTLYFSKHHKNFCIESFDLYSYGNLPPRFCLFMQVGEGIQNYWLQSALVVYWKMLGVNIFFHIWPILFYKLVIRFVNGGLYIFNG